MRNALGLMLASVVAAVVIAGVWFWTATPRGDLAAPQTVSAAPAAPLAAVAAAKSTAPRDEVEATGTRFDPVLWKALGDAGLLSLTTPESHDGAGLGFLELCRVLVEVGRTVAPVPLATDSVARLFLSERGTDAQQRSAYAMSVISAMRLMFSSPVRPRSRTRVRPPVLRSR